MYSNLFALISAIHPLSENIEIALSKYLQKESLLKKTLLLKEGNICDKKLFKKVKGGKKYSKRLSMNYPKTNKTKMSTNQDKAKSQIFK